MGYIRRLSKRDSNQGELVRVFQRFGWSVVDTSMVGGGFPDLVVGKGGKTFLVEVKQKGGKLSEGQEAFMGNWRGSRVVVVETMDDVIEFNLRNG